MDCESEDEARSYVEQLPPIREGWVDYQIDPIAAVLISIQPRGGRLSFAKPSGRQLGRVSLGSRAAQQTLRWR